MKETEAQKEAEQIALHLFDDYDNVYEWVEDQLSIEYYYDQDGVPVAVKIWITCGGPNVFLDTVSCHLTFAWGSVGIALLDRDIVEDIHAALGIN